MRVEIRGSVRGTRRSGAAGRPPYGAPRSLFTLALGLSAFAALASGGCTTGQVYVSQPQVNTRERLVRQRLGDTEWLRSQYEKINEITTTEQGIRDSRAFSGFYAEIAAKINPSQGTLGSLDIQNEALSKRAENWRLKEQEEKARQSYLAQADHPAGVPAGGGSGTAPAPAGPAPGGTAGTATTPAANPVTGAQAKDTTTPSVTTPLGAGLKDAPGVPSPQSPAKTEAKPMLLDLLHDRMAYRDALNAMIKARELDDAHDQGGMMLYDLNFTLMVVPGDASSQYVQVTLRLEPPNDIDPDVNLHELFAKWCASLQATMAAEIGALQDRYARQKLDDADRQNLEWFFASHVGGLRLRLQDRCVEIRRILDLTEKVVDPKRHAQVAVWNSRQYKEWRQNCYESITDHRLFCLLEALLDTESGEAPACLDALCKFHERLTKVAAENKKLAEDFDKFACACATTKIIKSLERVPAGPPSDLKIQQSVLEGIAWAVWAKYSHELGRIVDINRPKVTWRNEADPDTYLLSGLQVTPQAFGESSRPRKAAPDLRESVHALKRHQLKNDMSISNAGECAFRDRLSNCENHLYALAVEPAEYAQNISDVAARETLLNMAAALQVLLPSVGVTADTRMQELQRSQEILHALERRPLLTGFGMGQSRFGWVAGPKFTIEGGQAKFRHTPRPYDCSASIVVPAWLMRVKLFGEYAWIGPDGMPEAPTPLWGREGLTVNLPRARDALQRVTIALTASGPSDEPFLLTTRPHPRIDRPDGKTIQPTLQAAGKDPSAAKDQASSKDQSLVICGHELWRSPAVFVGSQRASRVEVLSDMEGIQAYFNSISYPGPQKDANTPAPADLLVVTAFGQARVERAVSILPPPAEPKTAPASKPQKQATLKTTFVDDAATKLTFSFPRPDSYAGLAVKTRKKSLGNASDTTATDEVWNEKNTEVSFTCRDDSVNEMLLADLIQYSRPGSQDAASVLKDGPVPFAKFHSKADRCLRIDPDSSSIQFGVHGTTDHPLTVTFPVKWLPLADVAYPGFTEAAQKSGALRLVLRDTQGRRGPELPLRFKEQTSADLRLEVPPEELVQNRAKILDKTDKASWEIRARLAGGTGREIDVLDKDGKQVQVSFTQEPESLVASVDPAKVLCKDPDKAGEVLLKITKCREFDQKYKALADSIRGDSTHQGGKATIILTALAGPPPIRSLAPADDGEKEFHLHLQVKDFLVANRTIDVTNSSYNPWTITLPSGDSSKPISLVDTAGKTVTITFQKE